METLKIESQSCDVFLFSQVSGYACLFPIHAAIGGYLELPSRVVKDSVPSQHRILRCINFGIGESSPNLVLDMMNLYLEKFEAR